MLGFADCGRIYICIRELVYKHFKRVSMVKKPFYGALSIFRHEVYSGFVWSPSTFSPPN